MQHNLFPAHQRRLFPKQLDWHEFPRDVRQRVCDLLAAMCVEIIDHHPLKTEEHRHEPRADSRVAS